MERCETILVPRGQGHKVLLLPEGSEALRAGLGSHNPVRQGEGGVTNPTQSYSSALGAFTPQCPRSHQWVSTGQTRDRKTGMAQGFYPFDFRPVSPQRDGGGRVE